MLQVVESVLMETFEVFRAWQFIPDLDNTNISKTGCRWLSKTNWKELSTIWLSSIEVMDQNDIYWEGCRYFSYCDWLKM